MVTAIKMHECKVLNFCKRSFAFLCAVGIMGYSLLTAPLSSNDIVAHADWHDFVHDSRIGAIIDWAHDSIDSVLDRSSNINIPWVQSVTSGLRASNDLVYNIVRPDGFADFAETAMQDVTNTGDWNDINVDSTVGISGAYFRNNSWHTVSFFTRGSKELNANTYFPLMEGEDLAVYMKVLPHDGYGPEDITIRYYESVVSSASGYSEFQRNFSFSPASSVDLTFYFYSYGDWVTYNYGVFNYNRSLVFDFRIAVNVSSDNFDISKYTLPTDLSSVRSKFFPGKSYNYYLYVGCSPNLSYFPAGSLISGQSSVINKENIYDYYDKRVYNTYKNTITNYNFNTVQYYYDQIIENPPTDPSEITPTETTPGTTGTVVIIDPFTLPPEWLEDDAELDTDHYILDSEQWESPFETIARYKSQVSAASIEEEEPWLDNGQLVAPLDVTQAMESFQYFAIELLDRSGILVVVASCLAFGLVIRIISLK